METTVYIRGVIKNKMEQTFLEKRIQERAKSRVDNDYKQFLEMVNKSPFGRGVKFDGKPLVGNSSDSVMPVYITHINEGTEARFKTNLLTVKKDLEEKYIKEETDKLLSQLDGIKYLLEQQPAIMNEDIF